MASIKVDHSKFAGAADAVDSYVSGMKKYMNSAESEVNGLASAWLGADYTQFKAQWNQMEDSDATYTQMIKALEGYSKFLKYAADKYKDAQTKAVNRANGLPKY